MSPWICGIPKSILCWRDRILLNIFGLFLGIYCFEVINAFHTAYKHFSTSCTRWILVVSEDKDSNFRTKDDFCWWCLGFLIPVNLNNIFNYLNYRNYLIFQVFLSFDLVKIICWRYHVLPEAQYLFYSLTYAVFYTCLVLSSQELMSLLACGSLLLKMN